jgi:tripartite-type tricarboxylate transporter receptor subunit TctC
MKLYPAMLAFAMALVMLPAGSRGEEGGFYRGKTIRLVLSTGVGGGYAVYGRALARHLPEHIDGHPSIIVETMPGAGGVKAANWLYAQAPRDGSVIGIVQVTVPLAPLLGNKGAQYDPARFNWLGSMDQVPGMCIAWHTAPIKDWADMQAKEFIVGGAGVGSSMLIYPALMNQLLGTHFKVIAGYADGSSVYLAMQRGEVMGACGAFITAIKATLPDWISEKKFSVPVVIAAHGLRDFPEAPPITDFITDPATRAVFDLAFASEEMDRPVLLPPGVPEPRVAELRRAFDATMQAADFRADAERQHISIDYVTGARLAEVIRHTYALPKAAIEIARAAMGNGEGGD